MPHEETLEAFRRGENDTAARLAERDLEAAAAAHDPAAQVDALCMLARVALRRNDLAMLSARALEADRVGRAEGDRRLQRIPIHLRAVAARLAGDFGAARALYQDSIALNEELGETRFAAIEHRNLAYAELQAGDERRARELFAESTRRLVGEDTAAYAPYLAFDEATVAALDHDFDRAAMLLRQAETEFSRAGVVPDPDDAIEIARLRDLLERARPTPHTAD
jgi:hypothetical protein